MTKVFPKPVGPKPVEPERLDLRSLTRFAAVVDQGGFSQAARWLALPRQSVHRSVRRLEEQTGLALLEGGARRIRLTDAGRELYQHARNISDTALAAEQLLIDRRATPTGRLRLTTSALLGEFLAPFIAEFLNNWPQLRIDADFTSRRVELVGDDYDIAIFIDLTPPMDKFAISLGSASNTLVAAPQYLAHCPPLLDPSSLPAHSTIVYGPPQDTIYWSFQRDGKFSAPKIIPRLRVDNAHIAVESCLRGGGVGLLPSFLVAQHINSGALIPILSQWSSPLVGFWAVYSSRSDKNPALAVFLKDLRSFIKNRPIP